jgi:O-antigen/teichoic acid export membrane protein
MRFLKRPSRSAFDFLALLSSRGVGQAVSVLIGLVLVRLMAEPVFGAYSLATTTVGLVGVIADFGLDPILTRDAALHRGANRVGITLLLRSAVLIRLWLAAALTLGLVFFATITPLPGRPDLLLIGGFSLLPRGVMRAVAGVLVGLDQVRQSALVEALAALATSILTVFLVFSKFALLGDQASAALWALFLGNIAGLMAALRLSPVALRMENRAPPSSKGLVSRSRSIARAAAPLMLVGLAGALFQSLDVYVVKAFYWQPVGPDGVALYAAPFRVLNVLLLVPTAWGVVALPRYARYVQRPVLVALALRRDVLRGFVAGLALGAGCMVLAEPLTALTLGPAYSFSAPVLAVIGWMSFPVCLSAPLIALLTASGRQRRIAASVIMAGTLALAANVLLASWLHGQGILSGLLVVAAIKVGAMFGLLALYWLSRPRALLGQGYAALRERSRGISG